MLLLLLLLLLLLRRRRHLHHRLLPRRRWRQKQITSTSAFTNRNGNNRSRGCLLLTTCRNGLNSLRLTTSAHRHRRQPFWCVPCRRHCLRSDTFHTGDGGGIWQSRSWYISGHLIFIVSDNLLRWPRSRRRGDDLRTRRSPWV